MAYPVVVTADGIYRTERGMVFKVERSDDGHLTVQTFSDGLWEPAPVRLAGLRVAATTRRLTARQIAALGA
jgi:hypothetical protein